VHFYGSLNLLTGEEIVTRSTVMKAETTALHLLQVLEAIPDKPVLMLIDKAPWHFGPAIDALLVTNPRLELMYFPTAAPDLNPQEIGYTQYSSGRMRQGTRLPTWQQVIGSMGRPGIRQVTSPPAIPTGGLAACAGLRGVRF
jgi:hypothetical protein